VAGTAGTSRSASRSRAATAAATVPRWMLGHAVPAAAFAVAASATLLAPWSVLGTASRSAFALAGAAASAGLLPGGAARLLVVALDALPAIAACTCAAVVLGRTSIVVGLAAAVGTVVLAASLVALVVPGIGTQAGPWLGIGVVTAGVVGVLGIGAHTATGRDGDRG